jgi:hypothetical protein
LRSSADELFDLVTDLERLVAYEPRVVAARWLTPPPFSEGSRAELTLEVPFRIPQLRRLLGHSVVEVSVVSRASDRISVAFISEHYEGAVDVVATQQDAGTRVKVSGVLEPQSKALSAIVRALRPMLQPLSDCAVLRGLTRADAELTGSR